MRLLTFIIALSSLAISFTPLHAADSSKKKKSAEKETPVKVVEEAPALPDKILEGEWTIYNIQGRKVVGEERPYLTFDIANKFLYGSNGCNTINAAIAGGADGKIAFENPLVTRMHCDNAPYEFLINTTLDKVAAYKLTQFGHEYYLDLLNARQQVVMVLRRHNMEFLDGAWRVTRIDGEANHNENVEIVIDINERRIHGNSGCNIINGRIFIDPDKTNSIQFHRIAATRATCPDIAIETAFLVALEEVETAVAISADEVRMLDNRGEEVLTLRRIDPQAEE